MAQVDGHGHGLREQVAVPLDVAHMCRRIRVQAQRPDEPVGEAGAYLDLVSARLASDLRAPRIDVHDLIGAVDHLAAREQLAVVVPAVDTLYETLDASSDVDGIVHDVATR